MEFLIISHTFPIRLHHSLLPNVVRKPHASESTIKKTKCPAGRHLNLHRSALDSQPVTSLVSVVGGFKLPRPKKKQEKEGSNKLDVIWLKLDTFSNCTLKKDRKDSQKKPFNFSDEPFSEVLETTAGCPSPSLEIVSGQLHQENFELSMFCLVGGFNHLEKYESQWEGLSHILWKVKNIWNHHPVFINHQIYRGFLQQKSPYVNQSNNPSM